MHVDGWNSFDMATHSQVLDEQEEGAISTRLTLPLEANHRRLEQQGNRKPRCHS